jgi:vacuolar protein 8
MQSAAAACICNLAANINSKEIIATSGALEVLVQVLRSDNQAAAAQAAGALWSLCVDNDMNKQRVADAGAIPHLIALLHAPDTFAQSQVCCMCAFAPCAACVSASSHGIISCF